MQKIQYDTLDVENQLKKGEAQIIYQSVRSLIIRLKSGILLKVFSPQILGNPAIYKFTEERILTADTMRDSENINIPLDAVYAGNGFLGHTMNEVQGPNLFKYYFSLPMDKLSDLRYTTNLFLTANNIIIKNNKKGIIFPDLSMENFIVKENRSLEYIDFEGIQNNYIHSPSVSSNLGNEFDHYIPKYCDMNTFLYTDNLDKKSLILMYFNMILGLELQKTVTVYQRHGASVDEAIETMLNTIGLHDDSFAEKVSKVYNDNCNNEYITEDAIRISNNYQTKLIPQITSNGTQYQRKFIKR